MKKFTIISLMLIAAIGCVFASVTVKTSLGWDITTVPSTKDMDYKSSIEAAAVWELGRASTSNTFVDLYASGSFQTDLKGKCAGDVFVGAGFTEFFTSKVFTTFAFGFDTLWQEELTCGPGLYVDFGFMCSDHFSCFMGTKVMHIVDNSDVNDRVNMRIVCGGGYKF